MAAKQFLVVGLGRFGLSVATSLYENGNEVMAVDIDGAVVEDVQDRVTHAVQADMTDPEAIRAIDAGSFDVAVVTIGSDLKASALATMLLKESGVHTVVCKAHDDTHGRLLQRLGADKIVYPERDMGRRLAHSLVLGNILDAIDVSSEVSLVEIKPLKGWVGQALRELNLPRRYGLQVVAIRDTDGLNASIRAETVIRKEDVLLVICPSDALARLAKDESAH